MRQRGTSLVLSGVLGGALVVAACGGKQQPSSTTDEVASGDDAEGEAEPASDDMVPPEKLDEIQRALGAKRTAAARCLSDAVLAGKADRNARGKVTLQFVIGRDGKARKLQIVKSTVQNEEVERCVVAKVEEIDFGQLSADLDWSYSYAFESM